MNSIVCVKRVPDPDAPATLFRISEDGQRLVAARSVPRLTSTFDESALEAALQLRDQHGGKVTLLSLSGDDVTEWLQETMATGADDAVLVDSLELANGDGLGVAQALAAAIRRIGTFDVVLCGRQASDTDAGVVGPALAELLEIPSVAVVRKVERRDHVLRVERTAEDGYDVLEVELPALLTVSSELLHLRYATIANIMAASVKDVTVWSGSDLGLAAPAVRVAQRRVYQPADRTECQFIEGDTAEDQARALAAALRSHGVI